MLPATLVFRYQCSTNTFQRAGYSSDTARQLMHRAILLAQQARSAFHEEMWADNFQMEGIQRRSTAPHVRLCLSLGPLGASLSPTQEFGGFYPPPYGPRGYSTDGPNFNWFADAAAENEAIDALTTFHLERLLLFAQDSEIWSCIDIIAFETVPLAREAIAIRRTMARLQEEHRDADKQWWISFVFPDGRCPQMVDLNGTRLNIPDLVRATLSPSPFPLNSQLKGEKLPVPQGLGINCTSVEFLPPIVAEMELACKEFVYERWPFLVLYPNGGDEFDGSLGVWKPSDESVKSAWVTKLVDLVDRILDTVDVKWSGIVVGGCCRCNAEQIDRLRNMLK